MSNKLYTYVYSQSASCIEEEENSMDIHAMMLVQQFLSLEGNH